MSQDRKRLAGNDIIDDCLKIMKITHFLSRYGVTSIYKAWLAPRPLLGEDFLNKM